MKLFMAKSEALKRNAAASSVSVDHVGRCALACVLAVLADTKLWRVLFLRTHESQRKPR